MANSFRIPNDRCPCLFAVHARSLAEQISKMDQPRDIHGGMAVSGSKRYSSSRESLLSIHRRNLHEPRTRACARVRPRTCSLDLFSCEIVPLLALSQGI